MRPVPWHVKGVHPDAREVAREAARRSGVSVGTWLNALIVEAADKDIPPGKPEAPAPHGAGPVHNPRAGAPPPVDDPVAAIGRQIDELKWRIDSLSRDDSARHAAASAAAEETRSARLVEAIARIDRRLDGLNNNRRTPPAAGNETPHRGGDQGVDEALAEITARQHALDDEFAQPPMFDAPAADPPDKRATEPPAASSAIEQQLADIATRIKSLQGSMHFDGLAADLARTIEEATPKRSI
jgi:localization factor PodJL